MALAEISDGDDDAFGLGTTLEAARSGACHEQYR